MSPPAQAAVASCSRRCCGGCMVHLLDGRRLCCTSVTPRHACRTACSHGASSNSPCRCGPFRCFDHTVAVRRPDTSICSSPNCTCICCCLRCNQGHSPHRGPALLQGHCCGGRRHLDHSRGFTPRLWYMCRASKRQNEEQGGSNSATSPAAH